MTHMSSSQRSVFAALTEAAMAAAPSMNVVISLGQGSAEAPGNSGCSEQEPQVDAGRKQPPAAEDSGSLPGHAPSLGTD